MALDVGGVPDVDAGAGGGGSGLDFSSGTGESNDSGLLAEMDAIMAGEGAVDAAAGFEAAPAKPFAPDKPVLTTLKPAEGGTPKAETKPDEAKPPEAGAEGEAKAGDDAGEPPPPTIDVSAEAKRLRKGFAQLAKEREAINARVAEANRTIERAKSLEAKAADYDRLPERIKADPLGFLEANGIAVDALLDKVIEGEKPPHERELEKLRREIADKEKAAAEKERVAAEKAESDRIQRAMSDWERGNTDFARGDTEKYDLINSLDAHAAVHQACVQYFELHRNSVANPRDAIISPAVAADYVEKTLRAGVTKSKFLQSQLAASKSAASSATAQAKPAQSSNGTTAPKRTGSPTLTSVASGDSAPSAAGYSDDENEREAQVMREMAAAGELPDAWA